MNNNKIVDIQKIGLLLNLLILYFHFNIAYSQQQDTLLISYVETFDQGGKKLNQLQFTYNEFGQRIHNHWIDLSENGNENSINSTYDSLGRITCKYQKYNCEASTDSSFWNYYPYGKEKTHINNDAHFGKQITHEKYDSSGFCFYRKTYFDSPSNTNVWIDSIYTFNQGRRQLVKTFDPQGGVYPDDTEGRPENCFRQAGTLISVENTYRNKQGKIKKITTQNYFPSSYWLRTFEYDSLGREIENRLISAYDTSGTDTRYEFKSDTLYITSQTLHSKGYHLTKKFKSSNGDLIVESISYAQKNMLAERSRYKYQNGYLIEIHYQSLINPIETVSRYHYQRFDKKQLMSE